MKNPAQAKDNLKKKILEQLDDSMPVKEAMPSEIRKAFRDFQDEGMAFVQDPYIEVAREYQRAEFSFKDLADQGLLHRDVAQAFAKYLMEDDKADYSKVRPYLHQYNALVEVARHNRNLVVCTGTGSGKTECFLMPLVDCIYRQHIDAGGSYEHHIRALILYPLNALVNDQVKRLRRLLRYLPQVTFGQYIGTTEKTAIHSPVDANVIASGQQILQEQPQRPYDGLQVETALSNELRTRPEWRNRPADILVTNYSMLERLLLAPAGECQFFDHCWNFIVIDEAHSYAGSVGTEISWLIRRLSHRLERVRRAHEPHLRFLATSATLSDGDDKVEKALDFASTLFPAPREQFAVETGAFAVPAQREFDEVPLTVSIPDFYDSHQELIERTIRFENGFAQWKKERNDVALMRNIVAANGQVSAHDLFQLQDVFDLLVRSPIPDGEEYQDIEPSETLRYLAQLVLCKLNPLPQRGQGHRGNGSRTNHVADSRDNWRGFLHDGALHASSPIANDVLVLQNGSSIQNPLGNRLDIYEKWRALRDNALNTPVHYYVFHYIYLAVCELCRDEALPLDPSQFMLQVTLRRVEQMRQTIADHARRQDQLEQEQRTLTEEWDVALGTIDGSDEYSKRLYMKLVQHPQVAAFVAATEEGAGRPLCVTDLARRMQMELSDLEKFFTLCSLARLSPAQRRNSLVEIRYHQVVRDIADIGIYFEQGEVTQPRFIRSTEEYHNGQEKIFSFGLCRECGQPYLLGYMAASVNDGEQTANALALFRSRTAQFSHLHAFAWFEPLSYDKGEEPPKPQDTCIWVDLLSGRVQVSEERPEGNHWTQMHWGVPAEELSYIAECPRCRNKTSTNAQYGIITPYEAVGDQYKVMVLDSFANLCEEEIDPQLRQHSMAGGRKILAFSDSRPLAAKLASEFERRQEARLLNYLTLELVRAACQRLILPPAIRQQLAQLQTLREQGVPGLDGSIQNLENQPTIVDPSLQTICAEDQLQKRLQELRYAQILTWETPDGAPIDASKFLILRTLRDSARQGLMARNLVVPRSATIQNETNWDELINPELGITDDMVARELCQKIYAYLVVNRQINVPPVFQIPGRENATYLDRNLRTPITATAFMGRVYHRGMPQRLRSSIYRKILAPHVTQHWGTDATSDARWEMLSEWLARVLRYFVDQWHILFPVPEQADSYRMEYDQVCSDLQLWTGEGSREYAAVTPFSIEEHTAQIDGTTGAAYQNAFAAGRINILSCSTTFEMGIDVGNLNNIFLGNLPPASANYRQRAGRAGRRPGAAAYILSLAGHNSHDQHYYSNVPELFWGKIDPPAIYLEKPIFAARHFRAEALHLFLDYAAENQRRNRGRRLDWTSISEFLLGWTYSWQRQGRQADWVTRSRSLQGGSVCDRWLFQWLEHERDTVQATIAGIPGYAVFENGLGAVNDLTYSAADDLVFQLSRRDGDLQGGADAYRFYQAMGGARLPDRDEQGNARESDNFKRMSLKDRLLHQLWMQRWPVEENERFADGWPSNGQENTILSFAQTKTLMRNTINVLSEACILPRYSFAVDVIELWPAKEERFANVELSRPLQIGLFEYAPGQVVPADKRYYLSLRAGFFRRPNDNDPQTTLADRLTQQYRFCPKCRKLFESTFNQCPECGGHFLTHTPDQQPIRFVTPEVFHAAASRGSYAQQPYHPKGTPVLHWGGIMCQRVQVPGTSITTAESSDRMIQYINTNYRNIGFPVAYQEGAPQGGPYFYVHEVQTNIAIWEFTLQASVIPDDSTLPDIQYPTPRAFLACQSALYALRRSIARTLSVSTRDIGVLMPPVIGSNYRFVFFDTAPGGGGNALALTLLNEEDERGAKRIRDIIANAIALLEGDNNCQLGDGVTPDRKPIPLNNYQTLSPQDQMYFRPATACYACLKDYDNQQLHPVLDRWDALCVLKSLLRQRQYEDYKRDYPPMLYSWYRCANGKEFQYTPETPKEWLQQIKEQEKED